MSRSIHTTRKDLQRARRHPYDRDATEADLDRKRRIKDRVCIERGLPGDRVSPTSSEGIPIRVLEHGSEIHYPAAEEDIRGVIERLPIGTCDGLSAVQLSLGAAHQAEGSADPMLGRRSVEILPGIYEPMVLGIYWPTTCVIRLFAYVYNQPGAEADVVELYLRFTMLTTLVHEIAHHVDESTRTRRGRWLGVGGPDAKETAEGYAERRQAEWVESAVIPYLHDVHAAQVDRLESFGRECGARLSLESLLDDNQELLLLRLLRV